MAIRKGMSESEAGRLGAIASKETQKKQKEERIENYYKNPNRCKYCNSVISYERRGALFCNSSCAASYNNTKRDYEKIKEGIKNFYKSHLVYKDIESGKMIQTNWEDLSEEEKRVLNKKILERNKKISKSQKNKVVKICKFCGAEKGHCKDPFACSKFRIIKSLVRFGFDITAVGTERYVDEFYRIRTLLEKEYRDNRITDDELKEKYGYTSGGANFHKILHSLGIKTLNHSESISKAIELGRLDSGEFLHSQFITEKHHTWDNKDVFLRSSNEISYANILDENQIRYEVESLRIKYYDSQEQKNRIAIPDFYLPDTNEIIEIKSAATLDLINMKDKFKSYIENGYFPKLILNHIEVDIDKIKEVLSEKEYKLALEGGIFKKHIQ